MPQVGSGAAASRLVAVVAVVALVVGSSGLAGCLGGPPEQAAGPEQDAPGERFQGEPRPPFVGGQAVIAVIDSGVNPYHDDFRDRARIQGAKELIPTYPGTAGTFPLSRGTTDYAAAIEADKPLWQSLVPGVLYDVPGTRIVGMVGIGQGEASSKATMVAPALDENGHGTAALGMAAAACPDCLLVSVEVGPAQIDDGLDWAAQQDWIDIIAIPSRAGIGFVSSGLYALDPDADRAWGRTNTEQGQVVVVAAGNGPNPPGSNGALTYTPARDVSYAYWSAGPDWVVTVGAVDPASGGASAWHTAPVDIAARGLDCDAPHPFSVDERVRFEGTSCSAPVAAGQMGDVLQRTRDDARDPFTGARTDQRLVVPEDVLTRPESTREDLVRAFLLTANRPDATDPLALGADPLATERWAVGDTPITPLVAGWGTHDESSLALALAVLAGSADAPEPDDDESRWFPIDQRFRRLAWGPFDAGPSRIPFPAPAVDGADRVPATVDEVVAAYVAETASTPISGP